MPIYKHDRLPGGGHLIHRTTWEDETARAATVGAASATGWLIGSGVSGLLTLARNSQDRRLARAATALNEASEHEDDDRFCALARDFTSRYPQLEEGHAALAQALQRKGDFEAALASLDQAVQLGLDETYAHMLQADILEDWNKPGKAIQEFTALTQSQIPEVRQISFLARSRLLIQVGDLDRALQDANAAIAAMPDEMAYIGRGNVHRSNGNHNLALEDYSRAIQLCPDMPDLLELRAELYEMLGRKGDALADRATAAAIQEDVSREPRAAGQTENVGRIEKDQPIGNKRESYAKAAMWIIPAIAVIMTIQVQSLALPSTFLIIGLLASCFWYAYEHGKRFRPGG